MPSFENWEWGFKIFDGTNSHHPCEPSTIYKIYKLIHTHTHTHTKPTYVYCSTNYSPSGSKGKGLNGSWISCLNSYPTTTGGSLVKKNYLSTNPTGSDLSCKVIPHLQWYAYPLLNMGLYTYIIFTQLCIILLLQIF